MNRYLELNVRTYVKVGDTAGVYFFSLDANHLPSVAGARLAALPYHFAKMDFFRKENEFVFNSKQVFRFSMSYTPSAVCSRTIPETLDDWLLERYYLFTKMDRCYYTGISATKAGV